MTSARISTFHPSPPAHTKLLDDRRFRRVVDLAHEILGALGRDGEQVEIARAAIDDIAGAARCLHRGREHGMHGVILTA